MIPKVYRETVDTVSDFPDWPKVASTLSVILVFSKTIVDTVSDFAQKSAFIVDTNSESLIFVYIVDTENDCILYCRHFQ